MTPLMVRRVVVVCGPPSWWGVRCGLVLAGCFSLWWCCCLAGSGGSAFQAAAVRHHFVLTGTDNPASEARAVYYPKLLLRGCRRPAARFPLFRSLVCARLLAGCRLVPSFAPPLGGCAWRVWLSRRCFSFLSVLAGFCCWPPAGGCCRRSCPPPTPRASSGFAVACLLLLVFARSSSLLHRGFGPPPPPQPLVVCVARVLPPCVSFFPVCPLLVCCCAPFGLSVRVSAGCCPHCPPLTPRFVFRRWQFRALCAHPACFFLPFEFALGAAPTPLCSSLFCGRRRPLLLCVPGCCFGRSGLRCTLPCCVVPKALLPKGKRPGCLPTGKGKRAGLCVLCARCV